MEQLLSIFGDTRASDISEHSFWTQNPTFIVIEKNMKWVSKAEALSLALASQSLSRVHKSLSKLP